MPTIGYNPCPWANLMRVHSAFTAWVVALAMAFAAGFAAAPVTRCESAPVHLAACPRESRLVIPEWSQRRMVFGVRRPVIRGVCAVRGTLTGINRVLFQRPPPAFLSSVA